MTRIAIIGSGEHAKKIAFEIEKIKNLSLAGFVDEKLKIGESIQKINNKKYKVISNLKGLKNKKFGMIIADNYRSRIYLQQLVINRLIPNIILILSDKKVTNKSKGKK